MREIERDLGFKQNINYPPIKKELRNCYIEDYMDNSKQLLKRIIHTEVDVKIPLDYS